MEDNEYSSNESEINYGSLHEGETPPIPLERISSNQDLSEHLFSGTLSRIEGDIEGELDKSAPTFGDVLLSIGQSVADSQATLDLGLIESARKLSETKINVVSEVIQELNEDGLPISERTEVVKKEVPLINFVNPTVHEFNRVSLSMDLSVSAMDYERGMQFTKEQNKREPFLKLEDTKYSGWMDGTLPQEEVEAKGTWKRGQVMMDAVIQPRSIEQISSPSEVSVGPQIYFSQGTINETIRDGSVSERSLDLLIRIRKASGEANANVDIQLEAGPLSISYATHDGFSGSRTNSEGEIRVTLTRNIPNARFLRPIKVNIVARLGEMEQSTVVSL